MTTRVASLVRRYAVPPAAVAATCAIAVALPGTPAFPQSLLLAVIGACAFANGRRAGGIALASSLLFILAMPAELPIAMRITQPTTLAFAASGLILALLVGSRARIESERNELHEAVMIERERLELVLDASHIAIGFLDSNLRFLQVNHALAELHRVPVREHVGRRALDVAPWLHERVIAALEAALAGKPSIEIEIGIDDARFDTMARDFVATFLPLRGAGGDVIGVGFAVRDVTAQRHRESEHARLLADASDARREADAANRMKDEFLLTLSHEMRSPLQGILGWVSLLRGGQLDAKQADHAYETLERIVRQQAELLNGLFDVSRIMAGKMELTFDPIDLSRIVREAFEDQQFSARRHGIRTACDARATVPVMGDAERLHQVLANLLTNAIKFTPEGGRVDLRCVLEGGQGVITVRDSGEGIPPDFIQHVFERFSRADRSQGRRHRGLGLGLSIVYHLVEMHGGTVAAESPGPGGGTTITVRLPIANATPAPVHAPASRAAIAPVRLSGVRVLLIEDDVNVRESTAAFLAMRSASVTTAASASDGIEAFLRAKPDVVVSDLRLPGDDGYAFLRRVRALETGRDIPVVSFSGNASKDERDRSLGAGFACHLTKPVDPEHLVRALAALVAPAPGLA